jgi:2-polyprenyl-3-methyl-5-hydroxy-6-metoxy-1,4-benzoquinol methylase
VIEHVHDQETFLKNAISLVRPKTGLFFLSSIAKTPEGWFLNIFMGEHILGLLPKGTHEYNMLISSETVEGFVHPGNKAMGVQPFETVEKTGAFLANPWTMEMTETPSFLRGNYLTMFRPRQDI